MMMNVDALTQAALVRYRACRVTPSDRVVILASTANHPLFVDAYRQAAVLAGADSLLIVYLDRPRSSGLPDAVVQAALNADVIADLNPPAWAYTESRARVVRALRERKSRWVWAAGFEEDYVNFLRTSPGDPVIIARAHILKRLIDGGSRIRVSSSLGTDLTIARGSPTEEDLASPMEWNDGGVVGFQPPKDGVDGTIIVVGALRIQSPRLYKRHIVTPVRLTVRRGCLTEIEPTSTDARFLQDWFDSLHDSTASQFAYTSIGFDHNVTLEPLDDYALHGYFGGLGIAFGMTSSASPEQGQERPKGRVDILLVRTSCFIDELRILEDGNFTQESGLLNPPLGVSVQ